MNEENSKKVTIYNPRSEGEIIQNSGSLRIIEQAMRNLNSEQIQNIAQKAAETAIELEKKKIDQNINYQQGKQILERHSILFDNRDKSGHFTRHEITTEANLGGGKIRVTSKSGATCFVATATFCDSQHSTVRELCLFRDTVLVNYRLGRIFIRFYWKIGPRLAIFVYKYPQTRPYLRKIFTLISQALYKKRRCYISSLKA
jgi:hypothetical protein